MTYMEFLTTVIVLGTVACINFFFGFYRGKNSFPKELLARLGSLKPGQGVEISNWASHNHSIRILHVDDGDDGDEDTESIEPSSDPVNRLNDAWRNN